MQSPPAAPRKPSQHGAAILLSLLLLALPIAGVLVGNRLFDQESNRTTYSAAFITGAILCVAAWIAFPTIKAARSLLRRPAAIDVRPGVDSPALLRAILAEHDLPCPRCTYNLRGLTDPACPECHEPIRLHVAAAPPPGPSLALVWIGAAALLFQATTVAISLYQVVRSFLEFGRFPGFEIWRYLIPYAAIGAVVTTGLVMVSVSLFAWRRSADRQRRTLLRWRILRIVVWTLALDSLLTLLWWGWQSFY